MKKISWKGYTLRWIFYRRLPSMIIETKGTRAVDRCSLCKKGSHMRLCFLQTMKDGKTESISKCIHCGKDYVAEPNTNVSHKLQMAWDKIKDIFWIILDKLHIVRSSYSGRYDMFGDESEYTNGIIYFDGLTGRQRIEKRKRKWWEYIIIKKK